MVYEGMSKEGTHSLGATICDEEDGDGTWVNRLPVDLEDAPVTDIIQEETI